MGFTISEENEVNGIDLLEHAETAYDLTNFGTSSSRSVVAARTAPLEPEVASTKEGASA